MRNNTRSILPNTAVTAKDIGRQLGLSQSTVSRILSNAPGHRVSAATRQRVLDMAASLGYRPNAIARSLRRRRTNIVGFYTGYGSLDARNAFLAEIIGGLLRAADHHRIDLLLHGVFRGVSTEDIYNELMDGRIDGLFIHTHASDPLVARFENAALPVIAIADPIPGIPSVVCDDADGVRQLIHYLFERGHRRIAYLTPNLHLTSVETRRQTFVEEMAIRGVPTEHCPVFTIELENTRPALEKMRQLPDPPTAVCCWNDLAALDLVVACRERNLSIPEDMAIVGFDGLLDPKRTVRSVVTIGANWQRITEEAMTQLVRQIEHRVQSSEESLEIALSTCMPVALIPGDTA